jgi:Na+/melibiose symporter-like transporter
MTSMSRETALTALPDMDNVAQDKATSGLDTSQSLANPDITPTAEQKLCLSGPKSEGFRNTQNEGGQKDHVASDKQLYTSFGARTKLFVMIMAAGAAFLSPLSGNIYYPALNPLAKEFDVSSSKINLTLTVYMITQALAPTIFGDFADMYGRRPAYLLGFALYMVANIGIALVESFAGLLILRCLQSAGSSGMIALASGVAADISTSGERGKYMGWVLSGAMVGPAI